MKYSYAVVGGIVERGIYAVLPTCYPNMDCSCGECKDPRFKGKFHLMNGIYNDIWLCQDCVNELGIRTLESASDLILVRAFGSTEVLDGLASKLNDLPSIIVGDLDYVKHRLYSGVLRFYIKETISLAGLLSFFRNAPINVECWYKGEQFNLKKNLTKESILKGEIK